MVSKKSRTAVRENKHRRMRHHLVGTAERPVSYTHLTLPTNREVRIQVVSE